MTALDERWNIRPEHFWLRGIRPEQPVDFDEKHAMWNVYGYAEASEILGDPATYTSDTAHLFPVDIDPALSEGDVTHLDPPEHTKLRALISSAFTPKVVGDLEPRIREITEELLDEVGGADRFDFVEALAFPLPVIVIAELLGLPRSDRDMLKQLTYQITENKSPFDLIDNSEVGGGNLRTLDDQMRQLHGYLHEHASERRRAPREDLLTRLVQAEVDGRRLTDGEVANFGTIVMFAGHITTTMLLGSTVLCLDAYPEHAAQVRADRTLVPSTIEESLRFLSPFPATSRATTTEVNIGGQLVPADQMLVVWLAAANRDGLQFADADVFDPTRDPNPHIAFSRGNHYCVGAPLARLEGRVALNVLLDRYSGMHTDPDSPPVFFPSMDLAGARSLPLRVA
ncbi:cytochrome P450 [Streptomyces alboflavus]|uniref:cytochrome P450 n=1 Tax=Streptomyces alboflavus TaxID=67267 RepID=UPI0036B55BEC